MEALACLRQLEEEASKAPVRKKPPPHAQGEGLPFLTRWSAPPRDRSRQEEIAWDQSQQDGGPVERIGTEMRESELKNSYWTFFLGAQEHSRMINDPQFSLDKQAHYCRNLHNIILPQLRICAEDLNEYESQKGKCKRKKNREKPCRSQPWEDLPRKWWCDNDIVDPLPKKSTISNPKPRGGGGASHSFQALRVRISLSVQQNRLS